MKEASKSRRASSKICIRSIQFQIFERRSRARPKLEEEGSEGTGVEPDSLLGQSSAFSGNRVCMEGVFKWQ